MKFVLDTNVFIAALFKPGGPTAHFLVRLLKGKQQVFYSEALIGEIRAVANRKKVAAGYIGALVLLIRTYGTKVIARRVRGPSRLPRPQGRLPDRPGAKVQAGLCDLG
jgi:predicted nucleic acid-binding protein